MLSQEHLHATLISNNNCVKSLTINFNPKKACNSANERQNILNCITATTCRIIIKCHCDPPSMKSFNPIQTMKTGLN